MRKHLFFITLCLVLAAISLPPALAWFGTPSLMISGGSGGPTVASVSLSNSTFTNNTANATVGTISVTMSPPTPAFSGSLSITGANSGGFHIVGATLLTNAAGTTSGTYSDVTIVSTQGASSRSISPTLVGSTGGAPAPPTQAQVAGFTTCILCFDFTASSGGSFYNGAAVGNAAQTNTWLDCAGASPVYWYHEANGPSVGPCPDIVNEPSVGTNTLHFHIPANNGGVEGLNTYHAAGATGITLPTNHYFEAIIWVKPPWSSGMDYASIWGGGGIGGIPSSLTNYLEFDAHEIIPGPTGALSATHNWNPTTCPSSCGLPANYAGPMPNYPPGTFDATSGYHTIGMRTTSDGTTLYKCMWIDGFFQNCVHDVAVGGFGVQAFQLDDAHRSAEILEPFYNSGSIAGDAYVQRVDIWGCPNWQTTACKTANANPGGY